MKMLGVNIATQKKTEKTMTELNIEANNRLTLSKELDEGKEMIPMFGAGYTGIQNIGNSCYLNSVLQVLYSMPELRNYYLKDAQKHLQTCTNNPNCFHCNVKKVFHGLASSKYSGKQKCL